MAKDLAIVLSNGSINSAVVTALAMQKFRLVMLHAEVTQQPAGSRVRAAYDQQVQHFKPYREHTLPMPFLSPLQQSARNAAAASDPRMAGAVAVQLMELLPLLAAAARYADHYRAAAVYLGLRIGGHGDDLAQATEYVQIWNELVQLPCAHPNLEITTPLLELEPWQVVDVGFQVNTPFEKTWSCLEESGEPCWACRGCRAREASFVQAGKPDPTRALRRV
jgi:7-cyano-7-deazaguanine synthase in queuosine biosynthesis